MRDTVIFDLDGTLALIDHRRHLVSLQDGSPVRADGDPGVYCGPNDRIPGDVWVDFGCSGKWSYSASSVVFKPDWPAFFRACVDDEPNLPVIAALHAHRAAGHHIMIVSGRSDEVRAETEAWLFEHVFPGEACTFAPIMRPAGDYVPDDQLKMRWLADGTIPRDRVLCAYDDRDKVVAAWRAARARLHESQGRHHGRRAALGLLRRLVGHGAPTAGEAVHVFALGPRRRPVQRGLMPWRSI